LIHFDDYSACEFFEDDGTGVLAGLVTCGFDDLGDDIASDDCQGGHGLPAGVCAFCNGSLDAAYSRSPDLVSWFVPSVLSVRQPTHPVALADRAVESDGGAVPDLEDGGDLPAAVSDLLPEGDRVRQLDDVGAPFWYSGPTVGERSFSVALADLGLDWEACSEAHVAEVLASLLPSGVVEPLPRSSALSSAESASMYSGAAFSSTWDGGERLRQWRQLTGRCEGAGVFS